MGGKFTDGIPDFSLVLSRLEIQKSTQRKEVIWNSIFSIKGKNRLFFGSPKSIANKCSQCGTCERSFTHKRGLSQHIKTYGGQCKESNTELNVSPSRRKSPPVKSNAKTGDQGERDYLCGECGDAFELFEDLNQHLDKHNV